MGSMGGGVAWGMGVGQQGGGAEGGRAARGGAGTALGWVVGMRVGCTDNVQLNRKCLYTDFS